MYHVLVTETNLPTHNTSILAAMSLTFCTQEVSTFADMQVMRLPRLILHLRAKTQSCFQMVYVL